MNSNEMRKNAESEILKLKEELVRTQYIDEIRQRELYHALVLKNKHHEYFHTITEKIRDTDVVPTFTFPKNSRYYEDYSTNNLEDLEDILTNNTFFLKGYAGEQSAINPPKGKKTIKERINLNDFEIYKANEFRLEALETGNPRDELERLDKELFDLFKKKDDQEREDEKTDYHRLVDPLLEKIKYPERYDIRENQYL